MSWRRGWPPMGVLPHNFANASLAIITQNWTHSNIHFSALVSSSVAIASPWQLKINNDNVVLWAIQTLLLLILTRSVISGKADSLQAELWPGCHLRLPLHVLPLQRRLLDRLPGHHAQLHPVRDTWVNQKLLKLCQCVFWSTIFERFWQHKILMHSWSGGSSGGGGGILNSQECRLCALDNLFSIIRRGEGNHWPYQGSPFPYMENHIPLATPMQCLKVSDIQYLLLFDQKRPNGSSDQLARILCIR